MVYRGWDIYECCPPRVKEFYPDFVETHRILESGGFHYFEFECENRPGVQVQMMLDCKASNRTADGHVMPGRIIEVVRKKKKNRNSAAGLKKR